MGYALPSGVVNTESVFYYAGSSLKFGPLVKEPTDQILVLVDYSQLTPAVAISSFDFEVDVSSNPQLVLSYPKLNATANVLSFLMSGGIVGQQYNISVRIYTGGFPRVDVLTVNVPSFEDCSCAAINPVPQIYTQLPLNTQGYVNSAVRYFWGLPPPANPNVMDQWYDTSTDTLYEWATDGTIFFWEVMSTANLISEAPASNTLYGRYNKNWVADPIQTDAPADGLLYVRFDHGWAEMPAFLVDAPIDGQYYARFNGAWHIPPGGMSDAPSDGTSYARNNTAWVHLDHTDITDWDIELAPYALIANIPIGATTTPLMDGVAAIGNSTRWARANHVHPSDTSLLPLAGGTMTGDLILAGNPVGNLDAVPKQYVDTAAANANIDCGTY